MASRQVRKMLQAQRESEMLAQAGSEDEEEELQSATKAPFNPFDLLSDEDQPAANDDQEEEAEEPEAQPTKPSTKPQPGAGKSGGKKASKKKKGKGSKAEAAEAEEAAVQQAAAQELESIDRLVQELNLQTVGALEAAAASQDASGGASGGAAPVSSSCALLAVDPQALRGDDELRRIFGASVVAAVDREEVVDAARRRRNMAQARGRPAVAAALRRAGRRGLLVTPKDHWPALDNAISMEFIGVEEGVRRFRYVWSPSYRHDQRAFEQCQASHDPNAIAALLQHAPYHVDSLLAMYDLYRHLGENQYAEEVLQRSLHALEVAWHPQFDVRSAQCRLDFELEENRGLFLALFRHVQGLSRAGCHRTALECAKLLLALEPEDPMGVLCMMDYLALRAGRNEYLHEFVGGWEADSSLALRPNFAYGLAMAAFKLEQQGGASTSTGVVPGGLGVNGVPAASCPAASASAAVPRQAASQLLLNAILLHPSVVPRLISKLQEKGSGREGHWTQLLARKIFTKPHDVGSTTLHHLSSIYVERSALLWKAPDALDLLRSAATRAADLAEAGTIRQSGLVVGAVESVGEVVGLDDWAAVRREAFPDDEGKNEFRHLRLADFSDNVNALPREELAMGPVAPPPDAAAAAAAAAGPARGRRQGGGAGGGAGGGIDLADVDPEVLEEIQQQIALAQAHQMEQQQARGGGGGGGAAPPGAPPAVSDAEMRAGNPLMMLLRSLLPWVNMGQQPEYGEDEEGEGGAPGRSSTRAGGAAALGPGLTAARGVQGQGTGRQGRSSSSRARECCWPGLTCLGGI